jgi:nitrate reductase alpha subunit
VEPGPAHVDPGAVDGAYAAGTRFLSLIGGVILSFYDWYADLPPAPQAFGDQTDVPESGDWWNSSYLVIWGTNLPTTRTPDAHFMAEAATAARRSWLCRRITPSTRSSPMTGSRRNPDPMVRWRSRWVT